MKANELRIGNYVKINGVEIGLTPALFCLIIDNQIVLPKPIPLTEDILLKCGFKFKDKGFNDLSVSYGLATEQIHFVIGNYYKKLTYLHELQNLYFALTNTELEINL